MKLKIKLNKIQSVYSGRHGCCCGCRGKHTIASKYRTQAQKVRGYKVDDDEVNDNVVKRHVATIEKLFANLTPADERRLLKTHQASIESDFISIDTNNRTYIAYFT